MCSHKKSIEKRRLCIYKLKTSGLSFVNGKHITQIKNREIFRICEEKFGMSIDELIEISKERTKKIQNERKTKSKDIEFVYFVGNIEHGVCKIGNSISPHKRISSIQTGCPFEIKMFGFINGTKKDEKKFHNKFAKHRISGEWFLIKDELLDFINETFK